MTSEKELPKLHPLSAWKDGRVHDRDGVILVTDAKSKTLDIDHECDGSDGCGERTMASVWPIDALASIRAAGLDPLAIAAQELIDLYHVSDCEFRGDTEDRKAMHELFAKLEGLLGQ